MSKRLRIPLPFDQVIEAVLKVKPPPTPQRWKPKSETVRWINEEIACINGEIARLRAAKRAIKKRNG